MAMAPNSIRIPSFLAKAAISLIESWRLALEEEDNLIAKGHEIDRSATKEILSSAVDNAVENTVQVLEGFGKDVSNSVEETVSLAKETLEQDDDWSTLPQRMAQRKMMDKLQSDIDNLTAPAANMFESWRLALEEEDRLLLENENEK